MHFKSHNFAAMDVVMKQLCSFFCLAEPIVGHAKPSFLSFLQLAIAIRLVGTRDAAIHSEARLNSRSWLTDLNGRPTNNSAQS